MKPVGEVLITAEQIREKVREMGREISRDYEGEELFLVGILKGAFIFLADLIREITIPVRVDFLGVSSYGSDIAPSKEIKVFKDLNQPVAGLNVLIVDDIIDTGLTTDYLLRLLKVRNPRSIKTCALLDKPSRRKIELNIDYIGFQVPDSFLVGYGLDFDEKYRNLPDIHVLNE